MQSGQACVYGEGVVQGCTKSKGGGKFVGEGGTEKGP